MTTTVRTTAIRHVPTGALRTTALLAGGLYRSGLVPRIIPTPGLIGAPLLIASVTARMATAEGRSNGDATVSSMAVSR